MKKLFSIFAIAAIAACNNTPNPETPATPPPAPKKSWQGERCFALFSGKDTTVLRLMMNDSNINGNLLYNYFEKDRNMGVVEGKLTGDTIIMDYSFQSEGKTSVREVAFLLKTNGIAEGHGEMKEQKGKFVFVNRSNIAFTDSPLLKRIDCR
ncbi:hypothetical protein [Sediminibacterium ginsengisoli]|uniref:NlpE N-terminal domain-containing protein n=1 Tax=Sediminibacterium ginsengisoli TaxID=413434 RepID=A0A1T4R7R3_9BACT|nr:hypothetical protein [Sediminibacterium ginsengisoli]SKA12102.1 hypothetical protein SAMN04488132_11114 [Sediminibacterium ginsengisoli]